MGADSDRTPYRTKGKRQKLGIYCTPSQKIEIELEFEFYRNIFYEELQTFIEAFIQAQGIFPPDAPLGNGELTEDDIKMLIIAEGIERKQRHKMIESEEKQND